jgi:hypothetical protein
MSSSTEFKFKLPFQNHKENLTFHIGDFGCPSDPEQKSDSCWKNVSCPMRSKKYCEKPAGSGKCVWDGSCNQT